MFGFHSRKTVILLAIISTVLYCTVFIGFSLILPDYVTTADSDNTSSGITYSKNFDTNSQNDISDDYNSSFINSTTESTVDSNITPSESSDGDGTDIPKNDNTDIENNENNNNETPDETQPADNDFTVGMWISMYELNFKGKTEAQYKSKIESMFDNAKVVGVTDIYFHVRPSGDAIYNSELFPFSHFFSGTQGLNPGYDPFEYAVKTAHSKGLKIHAWINPYRVISARYKDQLHQDNVAVKWKNDGDTSNDRYVLSDEGGSLYFNPAIPDVRQYIITGVKEILDKYDVDGIQIDDYFYPTTDESYDEVEYTAYKNSTTTPLSLGDWRRANVNALVSGIYQAVHQYNNVVFAISPSSHISSDKSDKNYHQNYADVALWMSTEGYCDVIIPQLYYGYSYYLENYRFNNLLSQWNSLPKHNNLQIIIGLAPYKIDPDQRPKADGTEWTDDKDILAKQYKDVLNAKCNGLALYSYSYVCDNKLSVQHTEKFIEALKKN